MDSVPSELLIQIAKLLDFNEVNCLLRTNKLTYAKLDRYRGQLPKATAHIYLNILEDEVEVETFLDKRGVYRKAILREIPEDLKHVTEVIVEAKRDLVVDFYRRHKGESPDRKQIFTMGSLEALAQHLEALLAVVSIGRMHFNLTGTDRDDGYMQEVHRQFLAVGTVSVESLIFHTTTFRPSYVDVINVCIPRFALYIEGGSLNLPEKFAQLPMMRKVPHLEISFVQLEIHNLSDIPVKSFIIGDLEGNWAGGNLTFYDVKGIMDQWLESRREIESISLRLGDSVLDGDFGEMLDQLDRNLAEVEPIESTFDRYWFEHSTVKRRTDGDCLSINFFSNRYIQIIPPKGS